MTYANTYKANGPGFIRRAGLWLAFPLLCLLFLVALGLWREWTAQTSINQEIARLQRSGKPFDNISWEQDFVAKTTKEGAVAWSQVLAQTSSTWIGMLGEKLPYVGTGDIPEKISPGEPWEQVEEISTYLQKLEPVLATIHQTADAYPGPVWQPIIPEGYMTLLAPLQNSRSAAQLLALDAEYAVYVKDKSRVLRDLKSMQAVADAFRWNSFLVAELVYQAEVGMKDILIQRSLDSGIWDADDLVELRKMVGEPEPIEKVWPELVAGERAMALATIEISTFSKIAGTQESPLLDWVIQLPSFRAPYLRNVVEAEKLAVGGLVGMFERAKRLEKQPKSILEGILLPAYSSMITSFENRENLRRLTKVAIAIKQFQLANNHWPKQLSDLARETELDILPRDLSTVRSGNFGYFIESEDVVYVWDFVPKDGKQVQADLPSYDKEDQEINPRETGMMVEIR